MQMQENHTSKKLTFQSFSLSCPFFFSWSTFSHNWSWSSPPLLSWLLQTLQWSAPGCSDAWPAVLRWPCPRQSWPEQWDSWNELERQEQFMTQKHGSRIPQGKTWLCVWMHEVLLSQNYKCLQFNSIQKNFNHPTRGNFVVVMAGS